MYLTVRDIMQIEQMKSFKLVAGSGGLGNRVKKIAFLDFEFARSAVSSFADANWEPEDFVISSFQFAKDNESSILRAVKKLCTSGTSGLAINNVFSIPIGSEVVRFANANNYPILIASDSKMYFENIIVSLDGFIKTASNIEETERNVHFILKGDVDDQAVKKAALAINYTFQNAHFCTYFRCGNSKDLERLPFVLSAEANRPRNISGSSLVKYQDGFFHIFTTNQPKQIDRTGVVKQLCSDLGFQQSEFHIGISEMHGHLTGLKTSLLEAFFAAAFVYFDSSEPETGGGMRSFSEIGIYRLIFPIASNPWAHAYRESMITPIIEHDAKEKLRLLDFVMKYEKHQGNCKDVAESLGVHENTVRNRIAKVRDILGFADHDAMLDDQLFLAVRLYRIHLTLENELSF